MRLALYTFFIILLFSTKSFSIINVKDYQNIFLKYNLSDEYNFNNISSICLEKHKDNNTRIYRNDKNEEILEINDEQGFLSCTYAEILEIIKPIPVVNSLQQKPLEKFILENEITITKGLNQEKFTFVFNDKEYIQYKNNKEILRDGWRWGKIGKPLRVFMNGEKTTWKVSVDQMALTIKVRKEKAVPYFLTFENKQEAKNRRINEENRIAEEKRLAEERRIAEEKAAEERRIAEEKAAEERRIAEEKAAEERRIAEEKAAEEKRLAEERRIAEENERRELEAKKLSLLPKISKKDEAVEYLQELQKFIKKNPDEFDIIKISELFITTNPILDGQWNDQLFNEFKLIKEYSLNSVKFKNQINKIYENRRNNDLKRVNKTLFNIEDNSLQIKKFLTENPKSDFSIKWIKSLKNVEKVLSEMNSFKDLENVNNDLELLISQQNEINKLNFEIVKLNNELRDYLKDNITTEMAPLILEQIKKNEKIIETGNSELKLTAKQETETFIFKNFIEPEQKRSAEKKAIEQRKLEEEKRKNRFQSANCSDLQKWAKNGTLKSAFGLETKILSIFNVDEVYNSKLTVKCNADAKLDTKEVKVKMRAYNENGSTWYSVSEGSWLGNTYEGNSKIFKVSDVLLDKDMLIGKEILVQGVFAGLTEDMSFLYEELGSSSTISINTENLIRNQRKYLLTSCSGGCSIIVKGKLLNDWVLGLSLKLSEIYD
jgi:hypothetical protein